MGITNSHLSPHSQNVRNNLPERSQYGKALRIALYQHNRFALQQLTGYDPVARQSMPQYKLTAENATASRIANRFVDLNPNFTVDNLSVECFVELVEKRWDTETVQLFLSVGPTEEMLVTFIATCAIRNHYPALENAVRALHKVATGAGNGDKTAAPASNTTNTIVPRIPTDFVKKHNLHHLFSIVCSQSDEAILMTFVEAGLYDPDDSNATAVALRIIAQIGMRMHMRALQRYGNALLSPLPTVSGPQQIPTAPEWFLSMLKSSYAEGVAAIAAANASAAAGGGNSAASDATHGHGHGHSNPVTDGVDFASMTSNPRQAPLVSSTPTCPMTDAELARVFLDPTSGAVSIPDNVAGYVAPLILILSTHKYPGREVIESLQAEALRTAVIRTKGMKEVAGWQLYQKQEEELIAAAATASPTSKNLNDIIVDKIPLLSPVAAILALADGPWTADTHRMHTPHFRRNVRTIFHALTRKQQGLNEDDINAILAYVPEE